MKPSDEVQRLEAELEAAKKSLQQERRTAAERAAAKDRFLATLSHEIRTPLNGIVGMLALVMDQGLSSEIRADLTTVAHSANSLKTLVDSVLEFSRLDSGRRTYANKKLDLHELCFEITDQFRDQARGKELEIHTVLEPSTPMFVRGDAGAMRQVLRNLVDNAAKYTRQGSVCLTGRRTGETLEFEVRDTGIGMEPEMLAHIFDPFLQQDDSSNRRHGGAGLGLAISHKLCTGMGGAIRATSTPGEGSCFEVSLPLHEPSGEALSARDCYRNVFVIEEREAVAESLTIWLQSAGVAVHRCTDRTDLEKRLAEDMRRPRCVVLPGASVSDIRSLDCWADDHGVQRVLLLGSGPDRAQLVQHCTQDILLASDNLRPRSLFDALTRRPEREEDKSNHGDSRGRWDGVRILVAEDNPVNQEVTRRSLERFGCTVELVDNGRAAVDALDASYRDEGNPFDLVLMDVQMPEMDGLEATRSIRAEPRTAEAKVVALTANALPGDRQMCEEAGMDDYLPKPVRLVELEQLLERWCPTDAG